MTHLKYGFGAEMWADDEERAQERLLSTSKYSGREEHLTGQGLALLTRRGEQAGSRDPACRC